MTTPSAPLVFLSYSRHNKDVMQRVVVWLREAGFDVWFDNEELTPGTPMWEAEIESAIAAAGSRGGKSPPPNIDLRAAPCRRPCKGKGRGIAGFSHVVLCLQRDVIESGGNTPHTGLKPRMFFAG